MPRKPNPEMVIAEQQLAVLKTRLSRLAGDNQDSGSDLIIPKGKVPQTGMEYIRKLRDSKYYETISVLITKQFEMAKLDEARQGAVVQDTKSFPKRTLSVIAVTLSALIAACTW